MKSIPEPRFAVIFTSQRTTGSEEEYAAASKRMVELAKQQKGFAGMDSVRDKDGCGMSVSYWESLEAITAWKLNSDHVQVQELGKKEWYSSFATKITVVLQSKQLPDLMRAVPNFETERLSITHLSLVSPDAILDYYRLNQDHLAATNPPLPEDFLTLPYWHARVTNAAKEFRDESAVRFAFADKQQPGRIIGSATLSQIARGPFQAAYLGYSIDKEFEGQGLMTEALQCIIDYSFDDFNLHRLMANYIESNEKSARVLKKLGFSVEGIAKDYLFINGSWRDHVLTSLTNPHYNPHYNPQN